MTGMWKEASSAQIFPCGTSTQATQNVTNQYHVDYDYIFALPAAHDKKKYRHRLQSPSNNLPLTQQESEATCQGRIVSKLHIDLFSTTMGDALRSPQSRPHKYRLFYSCELAIVSDSAVVLPFAIYSPSTHTISLVLYLSYLCLLTLAHGQNPEIYCFIRQRWSRLFPPKRIPQIQKAFTQQQCSFFFSPASEAVSGNIVLRVFGQFQPELMFQLRQLRRYMYIYIYFLSYGLYKFLLICSTWSSPGSYDPSMANLPVQDSIPYEGEY